MGLYAEALRSLGAFLGRPERARRCSTGSAVRLAETLAAGMPFFDDIGFWKRAQIAPNDLALAGVAEFDDLDRLTIFADNLVPHVLRVDGVLRLRRARSPTTSTRGELLPPGRARSPRSAPAPSTPASTSRASWACPARTLDTWLWDRGQEPRYKALPRHRTRTVYY